MDRVKKNTRYEDVPRLDTEEKLLYVCPFCRFNTERPDDIHYHVIGYHKILSEFFNDY